MVSRMFNQATASACIYGGGKNKNGLLNFKGFKKKKNGYDDPVLLA
jgi:hypothetical protein